jgi:SAM-dependent methyltransferase
MTLEGESSLDDRDLLRLAHCTPGLAQEASTTNLGYGNVYYALARLLRPKHVLVIGSGYGFTPAVLALALQHNRQGRLTFVDPSMSGSRDGLNKAHGGTGSWDTPELVQQRFACAGVRPGIVQHWKELNRDFFPNWSKRGLPPTDFAVIDGAHDGENASYDLKNVLKHLRRPGVVLMHDSTHFLNRTGHMGVASVIGQLDSSVERVTFPGAAGLTLLRFKPGAHMEISGLPPPSVLGPSLLLLAAGVGAGLWFNARRAA